MSKPCLRLSVTQCSADHDNIMAASQIEYLNCPNCVYKWEEERNTKYDDVIPKDRPDIRTLWQEHVDGCKERLPEVCKSKRRRKTLLCSCSQTIGVRDRWFSIFNPVYIVVTLV